MTRLRPPSARSRHRGWCRQGVPAASVTTVAAVADPTSQLTRSNLVAQYTKIIGEITTTAQDSSYNASIC